MNKNIIYGLTIIAGIVLLIVINITQDFGDGDPTNLDPPITVDGKIPPQLSDLFEDRDEGPHQKYENEESCLKCHKQELNIPGLGIVPKIPHEFRPDCISCHFLPSV